MSYGNKYCLIINNNAYGLSFHKNGNRNQMVLEIDRCVLMLFICVECTSFYFKNDVGDNSLIILHDGRFDDK